MHEDDRVVGAVEGKNGGLANGLSCAGPISRRGISTSMVCVLISEPVFFFSSSESRAFSTAISSSIVMGEIGEQPSISTVGCFNLEELLSGRALALSALYRWPEK